MTPELPFGHAITELIKDSTDYIIESVIYICNWEDQSYCMHFSITK
jgi:hypothetical protein